MPPEAHSMNLITVFNLEESQGIALWLDLSPALDDLGFDPLIALGLVASAASASASLGFDISGGFIAYRGTQWLTTSEL